MLVHLTKQSGIRSLAVLWNHGEPGMSHVDGSPDSSLYISSLSETDNRMKKGT